MEGNVSSGNMMPGASYGVLDLHNSMHLHHQEHPHQSLHLHQQQPNHPHHQASIVHPPMHDVFPLTSMNHLHDSDKQPMIMDYNKAERGKNSGSDDEDRSFNTEDGVNGNNDTGKGKKASPWQRMKWTDAMVKLLITVVSYIGEDLSECSSGGRRKLALLQKKGKWKLVSKVMAERDCYVSPQQCEDKFNDLNKRYKRLNDILGRGTSCKVVENPALLDLMNHISDKAKDDVRKILSSKHLFYEEMCSYHNGNRLHLPPDPDLQRSLQVALRSGDEHDTRRVLHEDLDEDDHQGAESDDREDDVEDDSILHGDVGSTCFQKRMKLGSEFGDFSFGNILNAQDANKGGHPVGSSVDMNQAFPDSSKPTWAAKQWISSRSLQLEEQRLHIQAEMLELEKQRFKWQRFSKKKDRELDKMRMENERMKLENERLSLELKRRELEIGHNQMSN
ncbi:hypothetical protein IHE45_14G065800 [Dioscorea alata]|uniref:Uncharacterized protein n=2 Tax=Dioscorea alata TaxID=55571 RepID=A0ACB7US72_DIOAL|nr:hypothetical protein IHE45_14G065800 [Dioscorea alata]KAH7663584.1 hypothetical protein IHE45_14G065800 [Dioscorea alata]